MSNYIKFMNMSVKELNRSQLIQLKVGILFEQFAEQDKTPSWEDIAGADILISDETVFEEFAGTEFSEGDSF
jgi:hypothetical protein